MLEIADKLGSVLSALIGLVGLVLTGYGLWLQRRTTPTPPVLQPPPADPPEPEPRLEVPDRSDWVPPSTHLPPGSQGYGGPPPMPHPRVEAPTPAPRRTALVVGLVLLGVAAVLGVVTWIL
ncbi:hypothetical protein [Saccharopolyspora phatthalungensis]|uniref:Uncharacterized protein n=1 Tax=Saccharopolyspora phatthalungensis TaxID=664693 RepID=A0A840PYS9_9PSEU|nr:hypothetical protein [Saccharopolyspora phatthalungensis]MBB5153134.1 hypothetical protein [Saccharopolyspora phatthalungensis]